MVTASRVRLAEQVLASHRAKLATAANKDGVRRQIKEAEKRLAQLRAERYDQ